MLARRKRACVPDTLLISHSRSGEVDLLGLGAVQRHQGFPEGSTLRGYPLEIGAIKGDRHRCPAGVRPPVAAAGGARGAEDRPVARVGQIVIVLLVVVQTAVLDHAQDQRGPQADVRIEVPGGDLRSPAGSRDKQVSSVACRVGGIPFDHVHLGDSTHVQMALQFVGQSRRRDGDGPGVPRIRGRSGKAPGVGLRGLVRRSTGVGPIGVGGVAARVAGEVGGDQLAAVGQNHSRRFLGSLGSVRIRSLEVVADVVHVPGVVIRNGRCYGLRCRCGRPHPGP